MSAHMRQMGLTPLPVLYPLSFHSVFETVIHRLKII
jgi:hypothetical protein